MRREVEERADCVHIRRRGSGGGSGKVYGIITPTDPKLTSLWPPLNFVGASSSGLFCHYLSCL